MVETNYDMFPLNMKMKYFFYVFPDFSDYFTFEQKMFRIFYIFITMDTSIIISQIALCKKMIVA